MLAGDKGRKVILRSMTEQDCDIAGMAALPLPVSGQGHDPARVQVDAAMPPAGERAACQLPWDPVPPGGASSSFAYGEATRPIPNGQVATRAWSLDTYSLSRPCVTCPFLKCGGTELVPGRLAGIVKTLLADDRESFICHKTLRPGMAGTGDSMAKERPPSGSERMCAGAMIVLEKLGAPSIGMRIAELYGRYTPERLRPHFENVIDVAVAPPD